MRDYNFKTVFISDLHLGTEGSRADLLLHFLKSIQCETLYLVGDVIDGWRLQNSWYWPSEHQDVVEHILQRLKEGQVIKMLPGNHDDFLRNPRYAAFIPEGIDFAEEFVFEAINGKKYLVLHGDQVDDIVRKAKWLAKIGDWAYRVAILFNRGFNAIRYLLGMKYWSLSLQLKQFVKRLATRNRFEKNLAKLAIERGLDGIIAGHSHRPADMDYHGTHYMNDGDWVESLTALVEHHDGRFEIIYWDEEIHIGRHELERMRRKGIKLDLPAMGQ
ncbi:MAG: UDP-2,3-diacylglucosamine diphosphatase [Alphaproteobacteria bacterium]